MSNSTTTTKTLSVPNKAYYCFVQGTVSADYFAQIQLRNGATIYYRDSTAGDDNNSTVYLGPPELWTLDIVDKIIEG